MTEKYNIEAELVTSVGYSARSFASKAEIVERMTDWLRREAVNVPVNTKITVTFTIEVTE